MDWTLPILLTLYWIMALLSVLPSRGGYAQRALADRNLLRPVFMFIAAFVLPALIFWALLKPPSGQITPQTCHGLEPGSVFEAQTWVSAIPVEYLVGAAAFGAIGWFLKFWFQRHTPDVSSNKTFREWVSVLKEAEGSVCAWHGNWPPRWRLIALVFGAGGVMLIGGYLAGELGGPDCRVIGASSQPETFWATFVISVAMANVIFWSGRIAYGPLWSEQGTSMPVRYALFGEATSRFLIASWMMAYPLIIHAQWTEGGRTGLWLGLVVLGFVVAFLLFVAWPFADWRVRYRQDRADTLSRFAAVMRRFETAFHQERVRRAAERASGLDRVDAESDTYPDEARRKSFADLEQIFVSIIRESRFRSFVAVETVRAERYKPLLAAMDAVAPTHKAFAEKLKAFDADERAQFGSMAWVRRLFTQPSGPDRSRSEREHDARKDRDAELDTILSLHPSLNRYETFLCRKAMEHPRMWEAQALSKDTKRGVLLEMTEERMLMHLDQGDYRYRLMYWCAKLLANSDRLDWVEGLAAEALIDSEHRLKRTDRRSLLLAATGAILATLSAWALATYATDIKTILQGTYSAGVGLANAFRTGEGPPP